MDTQYLKLEMDEKLLVPDCWKIVKKEGNMATVTDGSMTARTPIKNHGPSYQCPRCKNYGPWDGIICRSCGQRSDE